LKGSKTETALAARKKAWASLSNTKTAFKEPGSRNPKKGYGKRSTQR